MATPLPLAVAIGFRAVNGSTAAAGLLALYLAVLFQAWARPVNDKSKGTPFSSGIDWEVPQRHRWKNGALVLGTQVVFFVGVGCALAETAEAVVAGTLVFLVTLVGMTGSLWALGQLTGDWITANAERVLNVAFIAPLFAALVAGVLVAVF